MGVMLFLLILGFLLFLLARETIILIGLLVQLAVQIILLMLLICRWTILLGTRIGLWWKKRAHIRKMGLCAVEMELARKQPVELVDRGDGLYVPSKGEW